MPEKTVTEPKALAIKFNAGEDGSRRIYTNNGFHIETGEEKRLTSQDLPEGFPFKLSELADQLNKIDGMEVAVE